MEKENYFLLQSLDFPLPSCCISEEVRTMSDVRRHKFTYGNLPGCAKSEKIAVFRGMTVRDIEKESLEHQ